MLVNRPTNSPVFLTGVPPGAKLLAGQIPAKKGTGNSDLRPDPTNVLKTDAVKKQRMSLEAREEQKAIELFAAQLRRDAEAAKATDG